MDEIFYGKKFAVDLGLEEVYVNKNNDIWFPNTMRRWCKLSLKNLWNSAYRTELLFKLQIFRNDTFGVLWFLMATQVTEKDEFITMIWYATCFCVNLI